MITSWGAKFPFGPVDTNGEYDKHVLGGRVADIERPTLDSLIDTAPISPLTQPGGNDLTTEFTKIIN